MVGERCYRGEVRPRGLVDR